MRFYLLRLNCDAKGQNGNSVEVSRCLAVVCRLNQLILWLAPLRTEANVVKRFDRVQTVQCDELIIRHTQA